MNLKGKDMLRYQNWDTYCWQFEKVGNYRLEAGVGKE